MSRSEVLKNNIGKFDVDKPIYSVKVGYGNSISFSSVDEARAELDKSDDTLEGLAAQHLEQNRLLKDAEKRTYEYRIDVDSTYNKTIHAVRRIMLQIIKDIYPTKQPKRTTLYKWYVNFKDTDKVRKYDDTFLGIFEYYNRTKGDINEEVHFTNILGLFEKIRIADERQK